MPEDTQNGKPVRAKGRRLLAAAVVGVTLSGILGWQAATGARCPAPGTKVFLKEGKPPVGCDEIRASAMSMSAFFGSIAFLAIGLDRVIRAVGIDPPGWYHLIAWFLPLSLSFVIGAWLNRKYMPKASTGAAVASRA